MKFCSFCLFSGERLAALAVEDMDNVVTEGEVDGLAVAVAELVVLGQVDGGDDEDDVLAAGVDVQVDEEPIISETSTVARTKWGTLPSQSMMCSGRTPSTTGPASAPWARRLACFSSEMGNSVP